MKSISSNPSASLLGGKSFHAAILWFIFPTSLVALTLGYWRYKNTWQFFACLGLAGILIAAEFGEEFLGESGERILTSVGSLLLIAGHFRNFSLCRSTTCKGRIFPRILPEPLGTIQSIIEVARREHDHIVVGKEGHASFKALKLI